MADLNTIITNAYKIFNEPSGSKYDQDNRALAVFLANAGYFEICRDTHCARTTGQISTTSGTREYAYPNDFVALRQAKYGNSILSPISEKNVLPGLTAAPEKYYLAPTMIGFDPLPNNTYTIDLIYFQKPTADLALADTPTLITSSWHYVLAYYLCYRFAAIDKGDQTGSAAKWKGLYEAELAQMKNYFLSGNNADRLPAV